MATIATLRKSGNVESNSAFKGFPEGQMFTRKATISTPVLALNDVIQALNVYAGETLHALRVVSTDIDTAGSPAIVLDIGYGNSTTALLLLLLQLKTVQLLVKVVVLSSSVH